MKKLYVLSYGLYPAQITLETLTALRGCEAVYADSLDEVSAEMFRKLAPGVKLTAGLGRRGAAKAIAGGLSRYEKVGYLTYGNPLFINRNAAQAIGAAEAAKAGVEVFPAVSSIDALVNLFGLNRYSARGLRLVDASVAPAGCFFTPEMDTLFFVPDTLNLHRAAGRRKKFLEGAAKAYPPSAPVYAADCESVSRRKTSVKTGTIASLRSVLAGLNPRQTIFIPAVKG